MTVNLPRRDNNKSETRTARQRSPQSVHYCCYNNKSAYVSPLVPTCIERIHTHKRASNRMPSCRFVFSETNWRGDEDDYDDYVGNGWGGSRRRESREVKYIWIHTHTYIYIYIIRILHLLVRRVPVPYNNTIYFRERKKKYESIQYVFVLRDARQMSRRSWRVRGKKKKKLPLVIKMSVSILKFDSSRVCVRLYYIITLVYYYVCVCAETV